jgi:prepilin-type N-terminal cleavage/methylation domain-containing protein
MTYASKNAKYSFEKGFTLIELLVVLSVMVFVAIPVIVSYVSFSNSQQLNNVALDIKTMLLTAQSRALSEVNPPDKGTCKKKPLVNYNVHICAGGGSCQSGDDYDLYVICNNGAGNSEVFVDGEGRVFPKNSNITIANAPTNPIGFVALSGAVTNPASFQVVMGSLQKTITVQSNGIIQIQ